MEKIRRMLRWLRKPRRRARDEHQAECPERQQPTATAGDSALVQPQAKEHGTDQQDKDNGHSPCVQPVDHRQQEAQGEAEVNANGMSPFSTAHEAGVDEPAALPELSICKLPSGDEGHMEQSSKTSGSKAEDSTAIGVEQRFERHLKQWLSLQETLCRNVSEMQESNKTLSQQLDKANKKATGLQKELEQRKEMLQEKTLRLEMTERALLKAQRQAKECRALHVYKGQLRKEAAEKEALQEQLAQLQSENLAVRQQLEDVQRKTTEETMRTVERLQEELLQAAGKQQIAETSLKASTNLCDSLANENSKLHKDLDEANAKVRDLSAQLEAQHQKSLQLETANEELQEQVAVLKRCSEIRAANYRRSAQTERQCEDRKQERLADPVRKQWDAEMLLQVSTDLCDALTEENNNLHEDLKRANAKVHYLPKQLEAEHLKSQQLETENQELREQLAALKHCLETTTANNNRLVQEERQCKEKMEEKLADGFRKQQTAETSLRASTDYCRYLQKDMLKLHEDLKQASAKVSELHAQLEMERQESLWHEKRARKERRQMQDLRLLCQMEAASHAKSEETNTNEAMLRKQQEQRIAALESELERTQSMQQESMLQIAYWQGELESSNKRYLVCEDNRRQLRKKLDKANAMLAEANNKGLRRTHKASSPSRGR